MENQTSSGKMLPIIITIILTAVIVGGGVYLWQKNKVENSQPSSNLIDTAKQKSPAKLPIVDTDTQQKISLAIDPIILQNAQVISTCRTAEHQMPAKELQRQLGISSLLDNGYEMIDVCRDETDRLAFLLAKNEPNLLFKETKNCLNDCDRVAFGVIDFAKKETVIILSQHRLGIYAEAYNQFCRIDTIQADGLFADTLYLYCGSGESGGFTNWYTFSFSDDNLTGVQSMTELGPPEVFDVKSEKLLKKFHFKSNAQMQ